MDDVHLLYLLQVLILSPYETGMKPKETMWNTTRSASSTTGATTSPHERSLTHYRSWSNTTRVCKCAVFPALFLFLHSFIMHRTLSSHLKITLGHTCRFAPPRSFTCNRPQSVTEGDEYNNDYAVHLRCRVCILAFILREAEVKNLRSHFISVSLWGGFWRVKSHFISFIFQHSWHSSIKLSPIKWNESMHETDWL